MTTVLIRNRDQGRACAAGAAPANPVSARARRRLYRGGTLFQSVLPQAVANAGYDLANRLTTRTAAGITVTPSWDLNGNLTGDGLRTYGWDARNRLTAIQGVATYAYDTFGRRRAATVGTPAKTYLYDGSDIVQEQQGGAPSANLLTGAGIDERYTRATTAADATGGTPATSTYLTDALGSTVALATSTGTVATNYGYDPYGVPGVTGAANDNPYQFTGRENDGTGLLYNRARYYNPTWGRFISEDPIGLRGGINRYAYANGNPVRLRDPSGYWAFQLGVTIQGNYGFGFVSTELGIAIDGAGNWSSYVGDSGGIGVGLEASGSLHLVLTPDAATVGDLNGTGNTVGASLGEGIVLGGDYTVGADGTGSYGMSLGFGAGAAGQGGFSSTEIGPIHSPPTAPTTGGYDNAMNNFFYGPFW